MFYPYYTWTCAAVGFLSSLPILCFISSSEGELDKEEDKEDEGLEGAEEESA